MGVPFILLFMVHQWNTKVGYIYNVYKQSTIYPINLVIDWIFNIIIIYLRLIKANNY